MAQVKKTRVRDAIIDSAYRLFRKQSYLGTSVADIGRAANIAPSNIYVYFKSKFEIFYAVYEPWLKQRLARLERKLAKISDPKLRLLTIVHAIWIELPRDDNGFANNLMQAVSTRDKNEPYRSDLLTRAETVLADLLCRALPEDRSAAIRHDRLAHILLMAFDGFVVRHHVGGTRRDIREIAAVMASLLDGDLVPQAKPAKTTRRARAGAGTGRPSRRRPPNK